MATSKGSWKICIIFSWVIRCQTKNSPTGTKDIEDNGTLCQEWYWHLKPRDEMRLPRGEHVNREENGAQDQPLEFFWWGGKSQEERLKRNCQKIRSVISLKPRKKGFEGDDVKWCQELKQDMNRELNPGFGTRVVQQKQGVLSATTLTQTHALHPFLLPFTLEGVGCGVTPACPLLSLLCSKSPPSCLLKGYRSSFLFHVSLASLALKHA